MNLQNLIDYCSLNDLPSPFDGVTVPEPIDAELVKSYIMMRCGLLTPVYNEPTLFTSAVAIWFKSRSWEFEHLVNILLAKYSPIENVDRYDSWTKDITGDYKNTDGGSDQTSKSGHNQASGTDVETDSTTTTNTISAFNSSGYQPDNKTENGGDIRTTHGKRDEYSESGSSSYNKTLNNEHKDKEVFTQHLHGNVGVTSNEKLINEEIDLLERFNVYDWIASQFEDDLMITLY